MAFASCMRTVIFCFVSLWVFTLTVSRIWTFHHALQLEMVKRKNERWLLEQCDNPEFYFNMKEHTDLCATVVNNANSSIFLNALYAMAVTTHLCGATSCADMAQQFVQRLGWQLVGLILLVALFSPNVLFLLYRTSASRLNRTRERGLMDQYGRQAGAGFPHEHPSWSPYYPSITDLDETGVQPGVEKTGLRSRNVFHRHLVVGGEGGCSGASDVCDP